MNIQVVIFLLFYRTNQQSYICKTFIKAFHDCICVAAVNMKLHIRVMFMQLAIIFSDEVHSRCFPTGNGNISSDNFALGEECRLGAAHKLKNLLPLVTQKIAFIRKRNFTFSTNKKLFAELCFQIHHLL